MDKKQTQEENLNQSRRDFLKKLAALGLVATSSSIFFGEKQLHAAESIISNGSGICSSSLDCSGGGGHCGSSLSCGGQGSGGQGKCGSSLDCAGGGGKCGSSLSCSGS